jgi:hypothetical protein
MLCANILFHDINFDPKSFFVGNMALTIGIPSSIAKQGLFFHFCIHKVKKGKKFKTYDKTTQFSIGLHC